MIQVFLAWVFFFIITTFLVYFLITIARRRVHHRKQVERSLKMVPYRIRLPRETDLEKTQGQRDQRDVARETIAMAENMYNTLFSIYKKGVKNYVQGTRHVSLEIIASKKEIFFYVIAPSVLASVIEKTVTAHYPGAEIKKVLEPNIFPEGGNLSGVKGATLYGKKNYYYPIKTYLSIENEPLEALTNALSMLDSDEGAAIQILIRPTSPKRMAGAKKLVQKIQKGPKKDSNGMATALQSVVDPKVLSKDDKHTDPYRTTPIEEEMMKEIDRKASKYGFETRIRVIVAAKEESRSDVVLNQIKSAFSQFSDLSSNRFKWRKVKNKQKFVNNYIYRYFDDSSATQRFFSWKRGYFLILNSEELATIFHFPNVLVETPGIHWLPARTKQIPVNLPTSGPAFAKAVFRGEEELVRFLPEDRLRHMYVIGQTGVGKTHLLKTMILNDISAGHGVCYIDPHGDDAMDIINHIPAERADDVVIFDPADTERPMGLNLFEAQSIEEKDFVIQEAIQMLYRLYDPGHQGIMGPRFEHWFRNAALALMADPEGGTFIEVPRIFTDDKFLAEKLKHATDPVVRNFWINEMGQTADFHKSEVLGWFVGKFGAFMTNTTMRNILGQVKSSFNFSDIMDNKKILIVRLSKGVIGEMNMQLLGMIFISKLQMAAMRRAGMAKESRNPFYMYIDEFQNFATDNIAQIFSEARKFGLSLTVANQYISQMREDIRDSVFGNVGTVASFRVSTEDGEYLEKQFSPEFAAHDLINQENRSLILKLMLNGLPTRPFSVQTIALPGTEDIQRGRSIIELSRTKNARPREIIDKEIIAKMNISGTATDPGGFPGGPGA